MLFNSRSKVCIMKFIHFVLIYYTPRLLNLFDIVLYLFQATDGIFSSTCWPVRVCYLASQAGSCPLSLSDWAVSDCVIAACSGVIVAYMHYLQNELISWYFSNSMWQAEKSKASADFSQQSVKFVTRRRFTPGVELQGFLSSWQFSRPLNSTRKWQETL